MHPNELDGRINALLTRIKELSVERGGSNWNDDDDRDAGQPLSDKGLTVVSLWEATMTDSITVTRERATEIFTALDGIDAVRKHLARPENQALMYAIMSNVAVIRTNLAGMPRVPSN